MGCLWPGIGTVFGLESGLLRTEFGLNQQIRPGSFCLMHVEVWIAHHCLGEHLGVCHVFRCSLDIFVVHEGIADN